MVAPLNRIVECINEQCGHNGIREWASPQKVLQKTSLREISDDRRPLQGMYNNQNYESNRIHSAASLRFIEFPANLLECDVVVWIQVLEEVV